VLHALLQTPRVTLEQPGGLCERARGAAQEIVQEQIIIIVRSG